MFTRALFLALTAFFLTMNVLLWRAEYGGRAALGTSVPPRVVWEKVLTAPDSSSLTVFHHGKKIGFCHWITSVGEDLSKLSSSEKPPEGMVPKIVNYRLELDGNIMLTDMSDRLRFDSHLSLDSDKNWQEFELRFNLKPSSWEVRSAAGAKTASITWQDDAQKFSRTFTFAELQHPETLLQEFGGPFAGGILAAAGLPAMTQSNAVFRTLPLEWEARHESVKLGHSTVRLYRLQGRLLNRFIATVFISRVGELLRVELPDGIVLTNDQLGGN